MSDQTSNRLTVIPNGVDKFITDLATSVRFSLKLVKDDEENDHVINGFVEVIPGFLMELNIPVYNSKTFKMNTKDGGLQRTRELFFKQTFEDYGATMSVFDSLHLIRKNKTFAMKYHDLMFTFDLRAKPFFEKFFDVLEEVRVMYNTPNPIVPSKKKHYESSSEDDSSDDDSSDDDSSEDEPPRVVTVKQSKPRVPGAYELFRREVSAILSGETPSHRFPIRMRNLTQTKIDGKSVYAWGGRKADNYLHLISNLWKETSDEERAPYHAQMNTMRVEAGLNAVTFPR